MTVTTPMEGITAPARRATTPPPAPTPSPVTETFLPDDTPLLASRRQDGWTAAAQRSFLEAIAEGHGVEAACTRVGLSAASAYAYRRTAKGAAFALGWRAATLVARDAIAETLLVRALQGQVDTIVRGETVVTRHRHDNRLAMSLLARLDRQVEAAPDPDVKAARLVAQEFDAFLDLVARDEGPARAGLFLARRCGTLLGPGDDEDATADLAPIFALAAADRLHRTGVATAGEVPVADLDPHRRADWTGEQWVRAEAAGIVALAPPPPPEPLPDPAPETPPAPQHSQHSSDDDDDAEEDLFAPVWWNDEVEEWRTRFPPPPTGTVFLEIGTPDRVDYQRTLTEEESAAMGPGPDYYDADEVAALVTQRDAFFAAHREARAGNPSAATRWADDPPPEEGKHMSIFGSIKKAIFGDHGPLGGQFSGKKDQPQAAPAPAPAPSQGQPHPAPTPAPTPTQAAPAAPAAPAQPVDVEQVLTGIAQKKGNPDLNWRTSIVDLMKLLDLDSSLANRKELADELGYTGAKDGSAEMNIWLHKAVMRELEKSGGTVPAALKD
jgi:hypothetical protein